MIRTEFINLLTAYLMGWKSIRDCAEWLAGIDWESPDLDAESQNLVGRIELLVTEVLEGLRPEVELWQEAANSVANESGFLYGKPMSMPETAVIVSSNDRANPIVELIVQVEPAVKESQSWNISPLLAPA